jgi:multiple sugar transport system substrate-binding protein
VACLHRREDAEIWRHLGAEFPRIAKEDPWWLDPSDPHRAPYVEESVLGPTAGSYVGYNPAWGQVNTEQLWGTAYADVLKGGMTPQAAIDKAFKTAAAIFSQYIFE